MEKKARNILLTIFIINFCILLIVFVKNIVDKEPSTEFLFGAYFWVVSFVEIIIFIASFNRINKKNILIAMAMLFIVQISVILCVPAYSKYNVKSTLDERGFQIPTPAVMPSEVNAYGTNIPFLK